MGDGKIYFYPESKGWFTWKRMKTRPGSDNISQHNSLLGANKFLAEHWATQKKNSIIETKSHKFDIVFHKLKNE